MSHKQLLSLLFCNVAVFSVGNALLPLIPIRATRLGADSTLAGIYLAAAFAALAIGTVISGTLSSRFHRRRIFIAVGALVNVPMLLLVGQAKTAPLLGVFVTVTWFMAGFQIAMASILAAMAADKRQLGRTFGILGAGPALGQLISGVIAGPLDDRWGFEAVCIVFAVVAVLPALLALRLEDGRTGAAPFVKTQTMEMVATGSPRLFLLMGAAVLVNIANFIAVMGKPLLMDSLAFDSAAVTSTVAISGAASLPVPLLMGWLSDRWGRHSVLQGAYLCAVVGVGMLAFSTQLWHFWLSQILCTLMGAGMAAGSALVAEMVPSRQMSTAVAAYSATPWIGGVVGCATGGAAIGAVGAPLTFGTGAALAVMAIVLVAALRPRQPVLRPTAIRATQH